MVETTSEDSIMVLNTDKNLKLYYSIKEVASMLNVSESMLRFWEKEIPMIKPKTGQQCAPIYRGRHREREGCV